MTLFFEIVMFVPRVPMLFVDVSVRRRHNNRRRFDRKVRRALSEALVYPPPPTLPDADFAAAATTRFPGGHIEAHHCCKDNLHFIIMLTADAMAQTNFATGWWWCQIRRAGNVERGLRDIAAFRRAADESCVFKSVLRTKWFILDENGREREREHVASLSALGVSVYSFDDLTKIIPRPYACVQRCACDCVRSE